MPYIGYTPPDRFNSAFMKETLTGNGTAGPYLLTHEIASGHATHIEVFVGNVRQEPTSAYTIGGLGNNLHKELTFTEVVPNGEPIYLVHKGESTAVISPDANSVGTAQLKDDGITNVKVKSDAAIDATKIAGGTVTNTEFGYVGGVTSDIQTQITANTTAIGNVDVTNHTNPLNMEHETTPATPAANNNKLYFKSDNQLYKLDSDGNERIVGGDPEGIKTNAADIFTNFVKDMEVHGISALHTEAGFVDEMETAGDMINETAGTHSGTYSGTPGSNNADNYYANTEGQTDQTINETYATETDYKQQEWTKTNQGTSNVTIAGSSDSNAKLLLNMNGSNNGTTFTDATGTHTVTAVGNAVTKTSGGGSSATNLNGTSSWSFNHNYNFGEGNITNGAGMNEIGHTFYSGTNISHVSRVFWPIHKNGSPDSTKIRCRVWSLTGSGTSKTPDSLLGTSGEIESDVSSTSEGAPNDRSFDFSDPVALTANTWYGISIRFDYDCLLYTSDAADE